MPIFHAGARLSCVARLTMPLHFRGLMYGLVFSIVLVYALIVVNFQSWLDPFIIVALPGALAGIVWMLLITGTHISVPALTGAIMHGRCDSELILVVSFAKEQMAEGLNATEAAECRAYAIPASHYDGAGDDYRNGADGFGTRRGRRAECAAGPCRHRRPTAGDLRHADVRAVVFFSLMHRNDSPNEQLQQSSQGGATYE